MKHNSLIFYWKQVQFLKIVLNRFPLKHRKIIPKISNENSLLNHLYFSGDGLQNGDVSFLKKI